MDISPMKSDASQKLKSDSSKIYCKSHAKLSQKMVCIKPDCKVPFRAGCYECFEKGESHQEHIYMNLSKFRNCLQERVTDFNEATR